jgi:hypothetical protein
VTGRKKLCLTKHHVIKTYCGSGCIAPRILNLCTRCRWNVSFSPPGRDRGTHWIGGWVGPEPVWTQWRWEETHRCPRWEPNPSCPARSLDTIPTELPRLLVLLLCYVVMCLFLFCIYMSVVTVRECNQKFPDWPSGARTANGTALCHYVQLYRYLVSQSSEFCRHNPLYCFSRNVCCCYCFVIDLVRKLLDMPSYSRLHSTRTNNPMYQAQWTLHHCYKHNRSTAYVWVKA